MGRGRCRFTLGEKLEIVREAYEHPSRVYATAKRYVIDLRNIKRWRKLLDLPVDEIHSSARMYRPARSIRVQHQYVYEHLLHYFETERKSSIPVSIRMLTLEARR